MAKTPHLYVTLRNAYSDTPDPLSVTYFMDGPLKKTLKETVLEACVVSVCVYGLGTLALT